jgi:hypothetical protein
MLPDEEVVGTFDGIRFRVQFQKGRQVACDPICPNCGRILQQYAVRGQEPMLICPSENQGCTTPIRTFGTEEEMAQFLNSACQEFDKRTG